MGDPLVFDSWEEYQELVHGQSYRDEEEENMIPGYQRYGTYEEYVNDMEYLENMKLEDLKPVWEKMVNDAKNKFKSGEDGEMLSVEGSDFNEISGLIRNEFDRIFERYGLWYDFGFKWSLSCYRSETSTS